MLTGSDHKRRNAETLAGDRDPFDPEEEDWGQKDDRDDYDELDEDENEWDFEDPFE